MSVSDNERDDIVLAGEYALGLLEDAEKGAFEARLEREPALAQLVAEWNERFAAMAQEVAPVTPPARVRKAVEARLFGKAARPSILDAARRRWLLLLGGAAAVAAVGLVALVTPIFEGRVDFVAKVAAEDRSLVVEASARIGLERGELVANLVAGAPAAGRAFELWLIPEGADRPISLGLVNADRPAHVSLAADLAGRLAGAMLAISDEPPGGSPTGQPTGAVLATGRLKAAG